MTDVKRKPAGLVGRCFVIWGEKGDWKYQGHVLAKLDFDHYLVQFFEIMAGFPATLAVFTVDQMVTADPIKHRVAGTFEFFTDDEHLRDWIEHRH